MNTPQERSPLATVLLFASVTLIGGMLARIVVEVLSDRTLEELARHAAGESDFERQHPHKSVEG